MSQAPYHVVPAEVTSAFAHWEAAVGSPVEMQIEAVGDPGSGGHAVDAWSVSLWFLETHTHLPCAVGFAQQWLFESRVAARKRSVALPAVAIQLVFVGEKPAELGQLEELPEKVRSPLALAVIVFLTR